jgi:hypothetical protein
MARKPTRKPASQPTTRERAPKKPFPSFNLEDTLAIAQAIADENAGKPWSRLSLADAVGRKPDSSAFRSLLSASIQYGLTDGSYKATAISLTSLSVRIVMPKSKAERKTALLESARRIQLYDDLYLKFDQAKLPSGRQLQEYSRS